MDDNKKIACITLRDQIRKDQDQLQQLMSYTFPKGRVVWVRLQDRQQKLTKATILSFNRNGSYFVELHTKNKHKISIPIENVYRKERDGDLMVALCRDGTEA